MHQRYKKLLSLTIAILISAVCLFLFLRNLDLAEVWATIKQAHVGWMVAAVGAMWVSMICRSFRWQLLLRDVKPVGVVRLYHMQMIGVTVTGIMPGRLGDVVKVIFLSQKSGAPFSPSFATVVVERILDLTLVVGLTVAMLVVFPFPDAPIEMFGKEFAIGPMMRSFGLMSGAFLAIMILATGALVYYPAVTIRLARRTVGVVSEKLGDFIGGLLQAFTGGLGVFRQPARALAGFAWTAAIWTGILLSEYLLFKSFGIRAGLEGAALLTAALALAVAVPQAPGFIGVFQLATSLVLVSCFGVDRETAGAYAIVLWFVQMGCLIALGFISFVIEGVSVSDVREAGREHDAADGEAAG